MKEDRGTSFITRQASGSLRPFVRLLWVQSELPCEQPPRNRPESSRELVLPTGTAHLVFRLNAPLLLYAHPGDVVGNACDYAVLGGPRAEAYVRDISSPGCSVGAELHPGALSLLVGERADLLAHRHTSLADLWGPSVERSRQELLELECPLGRLAHFERMLELRLQRAGRLHPVVSESLKLMQGQTGVKAIAQSSGYSPRRLSTLFREAVGLGPKSYLRLVRFQRALTLLHETSTPLSRIALQCGYADQAHFSREFREFCGVTPHMYRSVSPRNARHVPLVESPRPRPLRHV